MAQGSDIAKRFGSLFLAAIFLITSVGFTAVIIWQSSGNNAEESQANLQEQLAQQQLEEQSQATNTCDIRTPVPASAEAVPETFKPEGDVTELATTDLVVGTGQEALEGDCLVVKYYGTLATNGEKFDGNFDGDTALQFPVGTGTVIRGWDQGMLGVKEGGVRRLVIPSDLGYGEAGGGPIPANADLVFVVKLIEIKAD